MKPKRILFFFLSAIFLFLFTHYNESESVSYREVVPTDRIQPSSDFLFPDMGCSVIYASDGEIALGGNNEDYINPFTMAWFFPPEDGEYGRVYFGYEGFIWGGGMNDQGLFFDALAVDQPMSVFQGEKLTYEGSLPDKAMKECGTVDCVIDLFSQYHEYDTWYHQFMFGDADGNSVIIEPNQFLQTEENYQVVTNFYQSQTYIPTCNTCNRYFMAAGMFEDAEEFSVELMRDILDAVHIDEGSPTLYSNVYDLKERVIYLYHFHDFENALVFQLDKELAKGYHAYILADLFPENEEYLNWAKPELDRIGALQSAYQPTQIDMEIVNSFEGDYDLPAEFGLPYPYYSISFENDSLYLKIKTDKAWLALSPISETSFYHVSSFSQFEVTFLQDEDGQVNKFLYLENGEEYTFTRIKNEIPETPTPTPMPPTPSPSATSTVIPTNTTEHQVTIVSVTPVENTKTPNAIQPTLSPPLEKSSIISYWWVIPVLGVAILTGWYLIWRSKS